MRAFVTSFLMLSFMVGCVSTPQPGEHESLVEQSDQQVAAGEKTDHANDLGNPKRARESTAAVWWPIANRGGCSVWNTFPKRNVILNWTGACVSGQAVGFGKLVWHDTRNSAKQLGKFEGHVINGRLDGEVVYVWANGDRYEGDLYESRIDGQGVHIFGPGSDWAGERYEGGFVNGVMMGRGSYTWTDGEHYQGDFENGEMTGKGVYTWANGDRYEGDFVNGNRHGYGKYKWGPGSIWSGDQYEGEYAQGRISGEGKYTSANGDRYVGGFQEDMKHGQGTDYWTDGSSCSGIWVTNRLKGEGTGTANGHSASCRFDVERMQWAFRYRALKP